MVISKIAASRPENNGLLPSQTPIGVGITANEAQKMIAASLLPYGTRDCVSSGPDQALGFRRPPPCSKPPHAA